MDKFIEQAYYESKSEKYKYERMDSLSFVRGATWANKQNAAEIAELIGETSQLIGLLSTIREADIKSKMDFGKFLLPQEVRAQIQEILSKYGK